ncbi:MAG TPA: TIGR03118 family protein [Lacipirellulaceae bacterium]|nr:TIGR03118 family protein [Lacipirellulaceae bacterium]
MARVVAILRPSIMRLAAMTIGLLVAVRADAQFAVHNLVSDDQSINTASITDGHLLNGWGVSFSGTSPFWVSSNGSGLAVLYNVNPTTDVTSKVGLEVTIPGDGTVTGQAFSNVAGNFNDDTFLFVNEDGTVSGWRNAIGTTAEVLQTALPANSYKGATVFNNSGNVYLYAANFATGNVDVLKGNAGAPDLPGSFTDPNLPAGYAPFNVQNLGGKIYVTYAVRDPATGDDVAGPGNGFVDAFDTNGNLLQRIASQGDLNSPWGLAIAPSSFGSLAGDLLVGNFGDGTINAFNLGTLVNDGPLKNAGNIPLVIDGLWSLTVGNNGSAGSSNRVYFSAGPSDESHGLFGVIQAVPEPATLWLLAFGVTAFAACRRSV